MKNLGFINYLGQIKVSDCLVKVVFDIEAIEKKEVRIKGLQNRGEAPNKACLISSIT